MEPSNERIDYQLDSSLSKRLTELYSNALEHFQKSQKKNEDGTVVRADEKRIREVEKYLKTEFAPKLSLIVSSELNLEVRKLYVLHDNSVYMNAFVIPIFSKISDWDVISNWDVFSGLKSSESNYKKDLFAPFQDAVDLKLGKLKKKSTHYCIEMGVYIGSFISEELFGNIPPLTARELAAVCVHELGHGLTFVEKAADTYHRADAIRDSVKFITDAAGKEQAEKAVSVGTLRGHIKNNPEALKAVDLAEEKLAQAKGFLSVFASFAVFATSFIVAFLSYYLAFYLTLLTAGILFRIYKGRDVERGNVGGPKQGDIVSTMGNIAYVERIADEFVSRHGLGSDLASALNKAAKYEEAGHKRSGLNDAIHGNFYASLFLTTVNILYSGFSEVVTRTFVTQYDPEYDRLKTILQNNMAVFKKELPDEVRDRFLEDTRNVIKVLEDYENRAGSKWREMFWGTVFRILAHTSPIDAISTGNLSDDYKALQGFTNNLIRNPFFFAKARLDSILKKK